MSRVVVTMTEREARQVHEAIQTITLIPELHWEDRAALQRAMEKLATALLPDRVGLD